VYADFLFTQLIRVSENMWIPAQVNYFNSPAPSPLLSIQKRSRKNSSLLYNRATHTAAYFTALFIIIPVVFFSKLYNYFCYQKNEVKKSLLLLILKNFQRSKIITDIYRLTSGLSTTDLFQIQASTEDSKKTYSEDRLFSRLPLPSALPRMWIRGNELLHRQKRPLDVKIYTPFFRIVSWAILVPKILCLKMGITWLNNIFLLMAGF
jgi:hypothetical protein